ncbi:hypothetical protein ACFYPC_00935 [Streptomyces sp. NPDC005808]|uniref:hypothetical protein n=1 Tax=Streptomyces sp. NPDC005808 TaxID=3364734 RepID=UPI0036A0277C
MTAEPSASSAVPFPVPCAEATLAPAGSPEFLRVHPAKALVSTATTAAPDRTGLMRKYDVTVTTPLGFHRIFAGRCCDRHRLTSRRSTRVGN